LVAGYDFLDNMMGWVGLKYVAPEFETTFREVKSKSSAGSERQGCASLTSSQREVGPETCPIG
jgi:hypothetical protein